MSAPAPTPECPRMTKAAKEGTAIAEGCLLELENAELRKALEEIADGYSGALRNVEGYSGTHCSWLARKALGPKRP